MGIEKNVASQKVGLVMVDATDFATPETGITVTGLIRLDGGASATLSNTISELTNGFYVVTLSQGETNADLIQLRFHDSGASCATQFMVIETDKGKLASILTDTATTLDNKIDSILADTITLSNATYGLDALETITSDILEALDSVTAGPIASILVDTNATLDNKIDSILADTKTLSNATYGLGALESLTSQILADTGTTLENRQSSILNKTTSILTDTSTTLDNKIDSILVDTKTTIPGTITTLENRSQSILADTITLSNATYGLDALETITSDILEALDSVTAGPIASILIDTNATLDNKIDSILEDTKEINSQCDSILADTITLSNATYGLNALETITSDILEALDSVTAGPIASILVDTNATLDNKLDSILADTGTTLENQIESILVDTKTTIPGTITTIDNEVGSILVDTKEINSQCDSILVDTGTTLDDKIDSILADTITLSNATYGLDALESLCSQVLADTGTTLENRQTSILTDTQQLITALVNKLVIREAAGGAGEDAGDAEQFNDADVSLGEIDQAFTSDGTFTTRKRLVQ